jgi:tetratricopeptide (TPR) repeat protein
LQPGRPEPYLERGECAARRGAWPQAATDFGRALERKPEGSEAWHRAALLFAEAGHVAAYHRLCEELLARHAETRDALLAYRTAQTCLLLPGAVQNARLPTRLAERATSAEGATRSQVYFSMVRALAEYREGRYSGALEWANPSSSYPSWNKDAPLRSSGRWRTNGWGRRQRLGRSLTGRQNPRHSDEPGSG